METRVFEQQKNVKKFSDSKPAYNPNFRYQSQQPNPTSKQNSTSTPQNEQQNKPVPMDIDSSKNHVQRNQFQPNGAQVKRQREPSFLRMGNQQPSFQHYSKQQRLNHANESDDIRSVYDDSVDYNCETDEPDCQSIISEQESVFLGE